MLRVRHLWRQVSAFAFTMAVTVNAHAAALTGFTAKVDAFNGELKVLGAALSVTGMIVGIIIYVLGLGGMSRAILAIVGGAGIASAKEILQSIAG
jgi:hypothetical protein